MTVLIVAGLAGWLLGSIPGAWLVVRRTRGIDVTAAGSSNVGARNAWAVTGSRAVGLLVLLIDAAKGLASVMAGSTIAGWLGDAPTESFTWFAGATALLCAIAAHNYNLFLSLGRGRLTGGKGLATAAGGFLLVAPILVPIWGGLWLIGYHGYGKLRGIRDSIPGNVLATVLIPIAAWPIYGPEAFFAVLIFTALVLPRHRSQMRALLASAEPLP